MSDDYDIIMENTKVTADEVAMEKWRTILRYKGVPDNWPRYEVSSLGRVRASPREITRNRKGFVGDETVQLPARIVRRTVRSAHSATVRAKWCENEAHMITGGRWIVLSVRREMLIAFVGPPEYAIPAQQGLFSAEPISYYGGGRAAQRESFKYDLPDLRLTNSEWS